MTKYIETIKSIALKDISRDAKKEGTRNYVYIQKDMLPFLQSVKFLSIDIKGRIGK